MGRGREGGGGGVGGLVGWLRGVQPARLAAAALNIDPSSFCDIHRPLAVNIEPHLHQSSVICQTEAKVNLLFVYQIYFCPPSNMAGTLLWFGSSIHFLWLL